MPRPRRTDICQADPGPGHNRTPSPAKPPASATHHSFEDVDELRSAEGLKAVISQRRANGTFTFSIFRVFERDGKETQTGFVPEDLGTAYIRMVEMALTRITEIKASGKMPFPIRT